VKLKGSEIPFLGPMRSNIQPHPIDLIPHPRITNLLHKRLPFLIRHGVRNRQHLDTGSAVLVSVLRRHQNIATAHDSQFHRETHRRRGIFVDDVDHIPPGSADDGEVGFAGVGGERGNGDLELHVADTHVLYLCKAVCLSGCIGTRSSGD